MVTLTGILLSGRSQIPKNTHCVVPLMWDLQVGKANLWNLRIHIGVIKQ